MPDIMVEYASGGGTPSPNNTIPRCSKRRSTFASGLLASRGAGGSQTPPQQSPQTSNMLTAATAITTPLPIHSRSFVRSCQKAKRVRFFKNGDQFFKGAWYVISAERFRSFDALLEDLTRTLDDLISLPNGVRCLLTLDGQQKIADLTDLQDGESYVCSSSELGFKRIDYENAREPRWQYCSASPKAPQVASLSLSVSERAAPEPNAFVHPKIVTVVRNGVKPRKVIRLLLNKRTAPNLLQVINDITAAVQLDTGAVRKLFTLDGKLVTTLADFFHDEDVFVAYGTERMSVDDFYLDSEESGVPVRPSPLLRRKFLHQRNQAKLRSTKRHYDSVKPTTSALDDGSSSDESSPLATPTIDADVAHSSTAEQESTSVDASANSEPMDEPLVTDASCSFPIEIEDRFKVGRLIGDGLFANVHECICRKTSKRFALKVIDKAKCGGKEELVETEVSLLSRLNHEHIVNLYDVWDLDSEYYLCMELVSSGDLFDALVSVRQYGEKEASQLLQNLMSALDYMHTLNIVHRDVKPENLLVYLDANGRQCLKLADFGLATEIVGSELLYTVCGTPTYVAPEILAETGYSLDVDVWAAGVILYIVLCGFPPFMSMQGNQEELFDQILKGQLTFPSPCWDHISNAAKGLIQSMLTRNKDNRCSASEVLSHPWITGEALVDPSYEELARMAVEASVQPQSRQSHYSKPSQSFYNNDNAELYYSRSRSMDNLSTAAVSQVGDDADPWRHPEDNRERSFDEESFLFYENQMTNDATDAGQ